jgi:hypothetical protein
MKKDAPPQAEKVDNERREFLRNSVYAAYATPLITALLVAEESAAASNCPDCDKLPENAKPPCCR